MTTTLYTPRPLSKLSALDYFNIRGIYYSQMEFANKTKITFVKETFILEEGEEEPLFVAYLLIFVFIEDV